MMSDGWPEFSLKAGTLRPAWDLGIKDWDSRDLTTDVNRVFELVGPDADRLIPGAVAGATVFYSDGTVRELPVPGVIRGDLRIRMNEMVVGHGVYRTAGAPIDIVEVADVRIQVLNHQTSSVRMRGV